jgi:hypothetical protein
MIAGYDARMEGNILAAGHDLLVHDIRREAAAGGEMLPIKLYEDLTRTPLRLPRPAAG